MGTDDLDAPGRDKASFDHIYDAPDPRAYYRTLGALDYEIPQQARDVVRALIAAMPGDGTPRVLDVCCSYGVNAALLRTDLPMRALHDRYAGSELAGLDPAEVAASDRAFYAAHAGAAPVRACGLDVAPNAIDYACRVGLLDDGWVEDLEDAAPSPALSAELAEVDLIMTTGGVGYITEKTFDRLVPPDRAGDPPWVMAMVLRMFPYDGIAGRLAEHGLRTEKLAGRTFPQRRFATVEEHEAALRDVQALGLDPAGLEADGCYHAELFVSRPEADAARLPLDTLLAGAG